MSQKIVYIVVSGLKLGWGRPEGKWLEKAKGKDSQKYGGTEWKNIFF